MQLAIRKREEGKVMSGECDKCGDHTLECRCKAKSIFSLIDELFDREKIKPLDRVCGAISFIILYSLDLGLSKEQIMDIMEKTYNIILKDLELYPLDEYPKKDNNATH